MTSEAKQAAPDFEKWAEDAAKRISDIPSQRVHVILELMDAFRMGRERGLESAAEFCDVYHAMKGEGLAVGIRDMKEKKQ